MADKFSAKLAESAGPRLIGRTDRTRRTQEAAAEEEPPTRVFGSAPVGTGRCTVLDRRDAMSDLGMENRGDDASIPRKTAWGQVDVAIEEIGVEVLDDLLYGPSGRGDGSICDSSALELGFPS
ncbi:unnamed protein product [Heligmosomoides polygyrus]|uniref:Uncharacterized protein n=1 Tax=Heligmosomoides polygyrus TaxID=6339 RepID=A0A3P7X942_HELPZ|nr:unnamed protein product [Heligmosomoides polygyrus]